MSGSALMNRALKTSVLPTWLGEHATRHCGAGEVMPPRFQSQSRCAKLSAFELGRCSFVLYLLRQEDGRRVSCATSVACACSCSAHLNGQLDAASHRVFALVQSAALELTLEQPCVQTYVQPHQSRVGGKVELCERACRLP